jgi:hypothetical protein
VSGRLTRITFTHSTQEATLDAAAAAAEAAEAVAAAEAALAEVATHHDDGGPLMARARRGVATLRDEVKLLEIRLAVARRRMLYVQQSKPR